jgi:hypothetical protein
MTTAPNVAQSSNFNDQPPLGSHPGGNRARCSEEVGRALIRAILRPQWNAHIPSCTVVSGTRSDLERIHSLLAGEPCLQPSGGRSPLVAIRLPQEPISARSFLKQLSKALTGTAPNGSNTDILFQAQCSMSRKNVSIIALCGLDEVLADQKPKAIDRFFKSSLPSLRPYGSGRAVNIVITCSPQHMELFTASTPLWHRCIFKQIEIYEAKPDDGTGDLTDFIAIGPNIWGKGQTLQQAREKMESVDGYEVDEYEIWHVHESCEVNELGTLMTDKGHSRPQKLYQVSNGR